MPNYRRNRVRGASYFFTVVAYRRRPLLCLPDVRTALRAAILRVRHSRPFQIDALVLLPDHLHCIWTLPDGDDAYSLRWQLIKSSVTRAWDSDDRVWQRRYWEHTLRDQRDFNAHCDYIHYNPVKHGLCSAPRDWPFSSFHRFVREGWYPRDWGARAAPPIPVSAGAE